MGRVVGANEMVGKVDFSAGQRRLAELEPRRSGGRRRRDFDRPGLQRRLRRLYRGWTVARELLQVEFAVLVEQKPREEAVEGDVADSNSAGLELRIDAGKRERLPPEQIR